MKKLVIASLVVAALAHCEPAFAFGPAGMGRDLIHTASIGKVEADREVVRAGFIRPNMPQILSRELGAAQTQIDQPAIPAPLSIVVNYVVHDLVLKTASSFSATAWAMFLR